MGARAADADRARLSRLPTPRRSTSLHLVRSQIAGRRAAPGAPARHSAASSSACATASEGDERRDVCWTATARRGKLVTRLYRPERSQTVWILVDAGRLLRARAGDRTKLDAPSTRRSRWRRSRTPRAIASACSPTAGASARGCRPAAAAATCGASSTSLAQVARRGRRRRSRRRGRGAPRPAAAAGADRVADRPRGDRRRPRRDRVRQPDGGPAPRALRDAAADGRRRARGVDAGSADGHVSRAGGAGGARPPRRSCCAACGAAARWRSSLVAGRSVASEVVQRYLAIKERNARLNCARTASALGVRRPRLVADVRLARHAPRPAKPRYSVSSDEVADADRELGRRRQSGRRDEAFDQRRRRAASAPRRRTGAGPGAPRRAGTRGAADRSRPRDSAPCTQAGAAGDDDRGQLEGAVRRDEAPEVDAHARPGSTRVPITPSSSPLTIIR